MEAKYLAQGLVAPITVTWEVTYACNLRCAHCLSDSGPKRAGELDGDEARALIDDLAAMGVFYINIGGGEPFVRPDFLDLLEYATQRGLPCQFSTNGMLVDEERARRLGSIGDVRVQVSLDGADRETNDLIRGRGSYDGALRALDLLSRQPIDELWLNTVVTRKNLDQLDRLYAIAREHGARLRLARLRPSGRGRASWEALHLGPEEHRAVYQWLTAHPDVTTGDSYFILNALAATGAMSGAAGWLHGFNVCGAGRATCCITPTGEVYPCAFLLGTEWSAGNIRKMPLSQMWETSPVFAGFRRTQIGECQGCPAYAHCGGGCRAVSYYVAGSIAAKDPECVLPLARA
ncbi:MAG: mycofactocin radical SAM maturase [Firmicutes bacterium]|nr:mycofactocin radical SAM maturase [Alicyclobacillaceae bacterium]MCL6497532.1 mycofactocin radical SAM maturase [Bacillota bacterium]